MIFKPIYKTILAGDGGTGKSTLLQTKLAGKFTPVDKLTIGIDFDCYSVDSEPDPITLLVYDLGGQERFQFIHKAFIYGAKAAIILYDLSRTSTFYHIPQWILLLQSEYPSIPILIVGSKKDLVDSETIEISKQDWAELKNNIPNNSNIIGHMVISSTQVEDCDSVFQEIQKIALTWRDRMIQQSTQKAKAKN